MPVVTVDPTDYERKELKTAPPDGFVMVRALPYGKKLKRRDKASRMKMQTEQGGRGRRTSTEIELETLNEWAVAYDFAYCIGQHNLTDKNDVLIDFTSAMSLSLLNPKVGSEIESILDSLNEEEEEDEAEDFTKQLDTSLTDVEKESNSDSHEQSETSLGAALGSVG